MKFSTKGPESYKDNEFMCDICQKKVDPLKGFYHCEICGMGYCLACITDEQKDEIRKLEDQQKRLKIQHEKKMRKRKNIMYSATDKFTRAHIATFPWNWSDEYWGNPETDADFAFMSIFETKQLRDQVFKLIYNFMRYSFWIFVIAYFQYGNGWYKVFGNQKPPWETVNWGNIYEWMTTEEKPK